MTSHGFHEIAPDTALLLQRADAERQRAAALAVCEAALRRHPIDDPRLHAARAALPVTDRDPAVRKALGQLVAELDSEQWRLEEDAQSGVSSAGEYQRAFSRARVANAYLEALTDEPLAAALEAAYEAHAALDGDTDTICRAIAEALAER